MPIAGRPSLKVKGKFFTWVKEDGDSITIGGIDFDERDMLMEMASIKAVFDLARRAAIALVGIGSIQAPGSSYYDLHPMPNPDRELLARSGAAGEFLAHLIRDDGSMADYPLNLRLVALEPSASPPGPRRCGRSGPRWQDAT